MAKIGVPFCVCGEVGASGQGSGIGGRGLVGGGRRRRADNRREAVSSKQSAAGRSGRSPREGGRMEGKA